MAISALAQDIPIEGENEPPVQEGDEPEPYEDEEFPQWMHDLRRAETIFIGAFPIAMLFSTLSYEAYRGISAALDDDPLSGSEFGSFESNEQTGLLIAGLGLSAILALADFILGKLQTDSK